MGMRRRRREQQEELFVTADRLPRSEGHAFFVKLNKLLGEACFDAFVESLCEEHYDESGNGRPSVPPDHSSLTRIRDRLPVEVHAAVFQFVLRLADEKGLLKGKTVAVDSTTLEANAAMKSIVRRDSGEDWKEYITRLMREEGVVEEDPESPETGPSDEEVRRFDKNRKNKKVSNDEWVSTTDPDARIAKMKDGRTHLAYKAEHVVDLDTELILAAEVYEADHSVIEAVINAEQAGAGRGSEKVERSFAHVCETGGSRRAWLHGIEKVRKRLLCSAMTRNLGLVMRRLFGMGTPRGLQGEGPFAALAQTAWLLLKSLLAAQRALTRALPQHPTTSSHANQAIAIAA